MSETNFTSEPPSIGVRVQIHSGVPPRPYVVKTWLNGKLIDENAFGSESEAERYRADQMKRYA